METLILDSMCLTPYPVKETGSTVPCGNCPECRTHRASAWSFRLMEQEKNCRSAYFLTLTYDADHIHISPNGFLSLCKRDLQLFFKRLRRLHSNTDIKYYAVGEYGTQTKRPHYHVIIFNAELNVLLTQREANLIKQGVIKLDGKAQFNCKAWRKKSKRKYEPIGHITIGVVNGASVGYTLKYVHKPRWKPMHRNDDREPQFSIMSQGLGKSYISEKWQKWHTSDLLNRCYVNVPGGIKATMPRYYKEKLYSEEQRKQIKLFFEQVCSKETWETYAKSKPLDYRNKKEGIKAAFRKMNFDNQKSKL